jgi:hypothetical protein
LWDGKVARLDACLEPLMSNDDLMAREVDAEDMRDIRLAKLEERKQFNSLTKLGGRMGR